MPRFIIEETATYVYEADTEKEAEYWFLADSDRQAKVVEVLSRDVYPIQWRTHPNGDCYNRQTGNETHE
jgi:hypothetical protein